MTKGTKKKLKKTADKKKQTNKKKQKRRAKKKAKQQAERAVETVETAAVAGWSLAEQPVSTARLAAGAFLAAAAGTDDVSSESRPSGAEEANRKRPAHDIDPETSVTDAVRTDGKLSKKRRKLEPLSLQLRMRNLPEPHLRASDVQQLLLGLLTPRPRPNWIHITNAPAIKQVIVFLVGGVSFETFCGHGRHALPNLYKLFSHAHTRNPGSNNRVWDAAQTLMAAPLSIARRREVEQLREKTPGQSKFRDFRLSRSALVSNDYPRAESSECQSPGWMNFDEALGSPDPHAEDSVLGVDCEMVETKDGKELARVTVVNAAGVVELDELVLPANPVTDYLTRYSGITPELLANVKTSLADVQQKIQALMTPETLLVGHSLENDLRALRIVYSRVIDTAVLFPRGKGTGMKHSLRHLTSVHLGRQIQQAESGHDSAEDARATIELFLKKHQNGISFGSDLETELVFDTVVRENVRAVVVDRPRIVAAVETDVESERRDLLELVAADSDEEVTRLTCEKVSSPFAERQRLIWGRYRGISETSREAFASSADSDLASSQNRQGGAGREISEGHDGVPARPELSPLVKKAMIMVDDQIKEIHSACPEGTLLVVTTHGSTDVVNDMQRKKREVEFPKRWGYDEEQQLMREVQKARDAITMFCLKT